MRPLPPKAPASGCTVHFMGKVTGEEVATVVYRVRPTDLVCLPSEADPNVVWLWEKDGDAQIESVIGPARRRRPDDGQGHLFAVTDIV